MPANPDARSHFAERQSDMTARWYENVKRQHGDVQAYIETRWAAYMDRWQEASRFIPAGSRVLDLGGGNHFPILGRFLKSKNYDYHYRDVDPSCVESSKIVASQVGLNADAFKIGFNDNLDFPDQSFDAVFSSHCIEHSFDLQRTFRELNRVLVMKGVLTMAVPFGWETNPEHPYFFATPEWLRLISSAGFRIRVAQIGCEYPEHGYDLFVCAEKIAPYTTEALIDVESFRKDNFQYIKHDNDAVHFQGETFGKSEHVICSGDDWRIDIAIPEQATEVLPIFARHDWSSIVEASWRGSVSYEDLYSWFPYVQPIRIRSPEALGVVTKQNVVIRPVGKHAASNASEGVFLGAMFR